MANLANDKAAALQQAVIHAKMNGQTIEKRKSVDSTGEVPTVAGGGNSNSGGVVTIKKGRLPSRKLEPMAQDNKSSVGAASKTKASPFLGGGGQSQSIVVMENTAATISNMSLGLPVRNQ